MAEVFITWAKTVVEADGTLLDLAPVANTDAGFAKATTSTTSQALPAAPATAKYAVLTMRGADAVFRLDEAITASNLGIPLFDGSTRAFPVTSGAILHIKELA